MRADPKLLSKLRSLFYVSTGGFGIFSAYSIYNGNENFYNNFLMPVFHVVDPETSHRLAVLAAKYNILPRHNYSDASSLNVTILGLHFENPLGLAAGFDKDGEAVDSLLKAGFGFVEIGSVTPLPQPGNEKPRVFRLKDNLAIINRYGFNSAGHQIVLENLKKSGARKITERKGVLGVNLGKNKTSTAPVEDYVKGVETFASIADYFVINISSPNTPGLRDWQRSEQLEKLLEKVVATRDSQPVKKPLLLKLAPDLTKQEREDIAKIIVKPKCRIDGLVISNTTISRPGLEDEEIENGGLSGLPLKNLSTQLISDMFQLTNGKLTIIGVGGVFSGQDAFEKIAAGASLIQLYTALAYFGPPRITRVKSELEDCLSEHGFSTVSEAVGSAHKKK